VQIGDPKLIEWSAGCFSKRGVDDGNQKVGALPSRLKRAVFIIAQFGQDKSSLIRKYPVVFNLKGVMGAYLGLFEKIREFI